MMGIKLFLSLSLDLLINCFEIELYRFWRYSQKNIAIINSIALSKIVGVKGSLYKSPCKFETEL